MIEPLFPRIARNEPDALRDCIARYEGLIWSLARRFCRNHADAEDAVQRIFVELWRSAARYDPTIAPEVTFVSVIARRELIDVLRQTLRRNRALSIAERYEGAVPAQEPLVERREETQLALHSIARLGAREQLVIALSVDRGLSHRCIARVTGLPVGTVKTHVRRGLLKLRGMLTPAVESEVAWARGHRADAHGSAGEPGRLCPSESCSVTSQAE